MEGFIKLHRQFLEWEWYDNIQVKTLFIHCLFKANFKEQKWHGEIIKAGEFVTSIQHLANETNLSIQEVRNALKKLEKTNDINKRTTSHYSIITIQNWNEWQTSNKQTTNKQQTNNKQATNKQQTSNKQTTTIEEGKNGRRKERKNGRIEKEKEKENFTTHTQNFSSHKPYGEYSNVYLTDSQRNEIDTFVLDKNAAANLIDELSGNIACKKEAIFDVNFPDMHIARLKAYWRHKQKNSINSPPDCEESISEMVKRICEETDNEKR